MPVSNAIKQLDLNRQIAQIRDEINAAIESVIDHTAFIGGTHVQSFEKTFAEYCETSHCIGVGNGTDALTLIFQALDIGPGDEVVTTPMSFIATSEALLVLGIKPVFADIEPTTYNLDPAMAKAQISSSTKALLPVHLYGQPASLTDLGKIARAHDIKLIEDAAQAHGSRFDAKRIGSIGDAAAFSFYPGKNLGAFGDGGAVTTNNTELANKIRMLADHGRTTKYEHQLVGVNSRLDGLQAAVLSIKLKYLDDWNARRMHWAARYLEALAEVRDIQLPQLGADRTHVYHQFVLQVPERDAFIAALAQAGVATGIHYPIPLHLQPAFAHLGYQRGEFPVTEQLANRCVSLPMYAELTESEVDTVIATVRQFYGAA